jgi:hypothetical protein
MPRLTVRTTDGEMYEYTTLVAGNLASGYLILCGEDGPAYLGTSGYIRLQAYVSSDNEGQSSHHVVAIANGRVIDIPALETEPEDTDEVTESRSESIEQRGETTLVVEDETVDHDASHHIHVIRELIKKAKRQVQDSQRKRGQKG